jgi:hypothetical protein
MAKDYGLEIDDSVFSPELYDLALKVSVEQHIVPQGTPIEWLDRMLSEMNLISQCAFLAIAFCKLMGRISNQFAST